MFSYEGLLRINTVLTGVYRMAYLNILWIAGVLAGLVVFGLGPASYALASYVDGWFRRGDLPPVARTFFASMRAEFWRSCAMGWILLAAGAIIVTNIFGASEWAIRFLNVVALFVLVVAAAYAFPIAAATDLTAVHRRFGAALMIGFGSLHWTILAVAASGGALWLIWQFAAPLLIVFGIGIPSAAFGFVTRIVFRQLAGDAGDPSPTRHSLPPMNTARGITE
ncbi:YesL family protein [Microbacterium karelineae]|uniref:YesL family protein n=1 Tax=Microbacterium karelineae TaxID=2654283 RepID=UPI0012EA360C|nr:DUF624 domain-containing protein [Microbacterium karelineae]